MCMCNFACKGHPQNDLYCVGWDTHSLVLINFVRVTADQWCYQLSQPPPTMWVVICFYCFVFHVLWFWYWQLYSSRACVFAVG